MDLLKKIVIFMVVAFKLLIYIINETITTSSIVVYGYLLIMFALSLPSILKIKFNKNSFIKIVLILSISLFMFLILREDNIFLYALVALITMNEDTSEIVKMFFYSTCTIYIITILFGYFGILPTSEAYRTIEGNTEVRISLGFPNANAVFTYFIPLLLEGVYLYKDKIKFNIIITIIATILFLFSKSRTGYYLTLLIIFCNLTNLKKLIYQNSKNSFLFFFIISILLGVLFGASKSNYINNLLSYRPWFSFEFLKLGPFAFGKGVPENLILDNLYLRLLANYGIIGVLLYYYIFFKGSKILREDRSLLFSSFFFLFYGVFEAVTVSNFVIVIFLKEIFKSYRSSYEES